MPLSQQSRSAQTHIDVSNTKRNMHDAAIMSWISIPAYTQMTWSTRLYRMNNETLYQTIFERNPIRKADMNIWQK